MEQQLSLNQLSHKDIRHLLLTNPLAISKPLNTNRRAFEQKNMDLLFKDTESLAEYAQQLKQLEQNHQPHCPLLWTMGECAIDECPLTRSNEPFMRTTFEARASQLLLQQFEYTPDKCVTYTSFGHGCALSELIILTKTLHQHPTAQLNIHMIDIKAQFAIQLRKETQTTHKIDPSSFNYDYYYEQLNHYLLKNYSSIKQNTYNPLAQIKVALCAMIYSEYNLHTMACLLQTQFPQAQLSFFMHDTVDHYCEYLQHNNMPHADVVTSVDVQDDGGRIQFSAYNYHLLCSKTLQHNPTSTNLWLDHNEIDTYGLFSIAASQTNDDEEKINFSRHPEALTVYKTLEKLYSLICVG